MSIETRLLHLERSLKSAQGSVNQRRFSIFGQGTLIMHQTSLDVDVSARTSKILTRINALETQIADLEERVVELESGLQEKIVITFSNSPYSVSSNNVILFCDTTDGPITVNLIKADGTNYVAIINCGASNNDIIVIPDGTDLLIGANESMTLSDRNRIDLNDNLLKGWY